MKLKRFLATLTAALTLGSIFALTACDSSKDDDKKDDTKSEVLTKDEWVAAFSEESFANMKFDGAKDLIEYSEDYNGNIYSRNSKKNFTIINANGIHYMDEKETRYESDNKTQEYTWESYYTVVDGEDIVYSYDKNTSSWKKVSQGNAHYYIEDFEEYELYFCADLYDECSYDAEKGGYIWNITEMDREEKISTSVVLKFKDKKVCEMSGESITTKNNKVIETETFTYKLTYGGQSLTLPKIEEPEGSEKITDAEWIAAFSEELFNNIKIEIHYKGEEVGEHAGSGESDETVIVADEIYYHIYQGVHYPGNDKTDAENYSGEAYYTVEDGTMMSYIYYSDTGWSKGPAGQYGFEDNFGWIGEVIGYGELYGNFTYDSEKGGYIITITDEDEDIAVSVSVLLKFKDKKLYEMISEYTFTENGTVFSTDLNTYKFTFGGQSLTLPNVD